jgi:hypothetical protein
MREIPPLHVLCLRALGPHSCSAEVAFAQTEDKQPSFASRMLRSFHQRPVAGDNHNDVGELAKKNEDGPNLVAEQEDTKKDGNKKEATQSTTDETTAADEGSTASPASSMHKIPLSRTPYLGKGCVRRTNQNECDLHHPVAACRLPNGQYVMEYGSPALDCLQSYIDALVDLGRMDDTRLGRHFFEEYRVHILMAANRNMPLTQLLQNEAATPPEVQVEAIAPQATTRTKKRRRSAAGSASRASKAKANAQAQSDDGNTDTSNMSVALGSLSLYNCTLSRDTLEALVESGLGPNLAVLDLTGIHGLTDDMISTVLLPTCVNLRRLSLKNGRRLTVNTLRSVAQYQARLVTLDIGGCFNMCAEDVLEVAPLLRVMTELHASGLGWTDETVASLLSMRTSSTSMSNNQNTGWQALSLGFSLQLTAPALRTSLMNAADTLISLALPFCESLVDNALMGMLGRNMPQLQYLDVRGNGGLTTLTGWYDGRVSADLPAQALVVLGRYSGMSESSVEETKRVHPVDAADLTVYLDGQGMGAGIRCKSPVQKQDS